MQAAEVDTQLGKVALAVEVLHMGQERPIPVVVVVVEKILRQRELLLHKPAVAA